MTDWMWTRMGWWFYQRANNSPPTFINSVILMTHCLIDWLARWSCACLIRFLLIGSLIVLLSDCLRWLYDNQLLNDGVRCGAPGKVRKQYKATVACNQHPFDYLIAQPSASLYPPGKAWLASLTYLCCICKNLFYNVDLCSFWTL